MRYSLVNAFLPISLAQALTLTASVVDSLEASFGCPWRVTVHAFSALEVYTTFVDPAIEQSVEHENAPSVLVAAAPLETLSKALWDSARHVRLTAVPRGAAAPECAFASLEFKGSYPRKASLYVQPRSPMFEAALMAREPKIRCADAPWSHGRRSEALPAWR